MRNKRAWLKLMEAGVAVVLLGSVLLAVYVNNNVLGVDRGFLLDYEQEILDEIAMNDSLRTSVLNCEVGGVNSGEDMYDFIDSKLPKNYGFAVTCCYVNGSCGESLLDPTGGINKDVFVRERIISSNLTMYSPRRITIYSYVE
jgi:hypothetical protein